MLEYIKAAFLVSPDIRGLGRVPVNLLAVVCLGVLGFGDPGFWLLGVGLEMAFITSLATNSRFQQVVRASRLEQRVPGVTATKDALAGALPPQERKLYEALVAKVARIERTYGEGDADDFLVDGNKEALSKLVGLYLRLLHFRSALLGSGLGTTDAELAAERGRLESELSEEGLSASLRESKAATLAIVRKRIANVERRREGLQEAESDLDRIEAQVDLALEDASMHERPGAISADIGLTSQLLSGGIGDFGVDSDMGGGPVPDASSTSQRRDAEWTKK